MPLNREKRARVLFCARLHRKAGRLSACGLDVVEVLVKALGTDGRLDLSHATIAERACCHVATVVRALAQLRALGLVDWTRRMVRRAATSWQAEQISNAYVLRPEAATPPAARPRSTCDTQGARAERNRVIKRAVLNPQIEDERGRHQAAAQFRALGLPVPAHLEG
ncbi:helix-turn-helix domain-containing protein [Limobrevibacterium gyesilva]|uniref:Helix-turn-helix domain-containing protein n=1 Tax=Limobrevibacterium gyesilva TaxID=2991712 RepID=A0AA41YTN2_9PROT|nr:hypothetical protein [Limobrevibacterium gyesilva]MCW3476275.1 hypothetical protein [Limobrevibacterium gyesilva]